MSRVSKSMKRKSDDQFVPDLSDLTYKQPLQKKDKKKRLMRRQAAIDQCPNYSQGAWDLDENQKYLDFLIINKDYFETQHLRRSHRVFLNLSKLLPKRTPEQCRSHHQKTEQQSSSTKIEEIIEFARMRLHKKYQLSMRRTSEEYYTRLQQTGFFMEEMMGEIKIALNIDMIDAE